jgi:ABC-type uncharacterized transport system permease subunit
MSRLVKESEYFIAWSAFWIGATIGGFIAGAIAGAIIGFMLGAAGIDLQQIKVASGVAGFIIAVPVSYICFRFIVDRLIVKKMEKQMLSIN